MARVLRLSQRARSCPGQAGFKIYPIVLQLVASAREALACLETAEALGWLGPLEPELGALFQHVIGTLVRLCEPRR